MRSSFVIVILALILGSGFELFQIYELYNSNKLLASEIQIIHNDLITENKKYKKLLSVKIYPEFKNRSGLKAIDFGANSIDSFLASLPTADTPYRPYNPRDYYFYDLKRDSLFITQLSIPNKDEYKINQMLKATCDARFFCDQCRCGIWLPFISKTAEDSVYLFLPVIDHHLSYTLSVNDSVVSFNPRLYVPKQDTIKITSQLLVLNYLTDLSIDTFNTEEIFIKQSDQYQNIQEK